MSTTTADIVNSDIFWTFVALALERLSDLQHCFTGLCMARETYAVPVYGMLSNWA